MLAFIWGFNMNLVVSYLSILILSITAMVITLIGFSEVTKQKAIEYKHKDIEAIRCLNKYPKLPSKRGRKR